ncbi:hypothetical protein HDV04_001311 [Boothiomyces sp. JEL0838]|nr:hypothetical protein HDV04_001311 [Boothiomyces sp. JEL0838]
MGHFTTSYAAHLTPNVLMATQYDYNMYSYDADVHLGVQVTPAGKNQVLKAKFSLQKGIGASFTGMFGNIMYTIGIDTGFGKNPQQSFGIQLEFN